MCRSSQQRRMTALGSEPHRQSAKRKAAITLSPRTRTRIGDDMPLPPPLSDADTKAIPTAIAIETASAMPSATATANASDQKADAERASVATVAAGGVVSTTAGTVVSRSSGSPATIASPAPLWLAAAVQSYAKFGYAVFEPNQLLSPDVLQLLRAEADQLLASSLTTRTDTDTDTDTASGVDFESLIAAGCVVEPLISGSLPDSHPARVQRSAYAAERDRAVSAQRSGSTATASATAASATKTGANVPDLSRSTAIVNQFLFHPQTAACVSALLASSSPAPASPAPASPAPASPAPAAVYFFNEHYVIKPPLQSAAGRETSSASPPPDTSFAWHTDAAEQLMACMKPADTTRYVSLWCALDDMTAQNGTLVLLPGHTDVRTEPDAKSCERDTVRLIAPAGSVVAFASTLWHASDTNRSTRFRRAYYAQFSEFPLTATVISQTPIAMAVPLSLTLAPS